MRRSPVRVAVVSSSTIVREGVVSLVGRLGDRAIVVDTELSLGGCAQVDVVVYDLGAAPGPIGPTGHRQLRRLAGLGLPMVALVYDGVASHGGRTVDEPGGAQLVSLAVTADELWKVLERAVPARARLRADRHEAGDPGLPGGLTHRELTVITLIGSGLSNEQIAAQMYVSGNTVKTYVRTAYRKLGIRSRIHAALWALEHGLVARPVHENATNGGDPPARGPSGPGLTTSSLPP